MTQKIRVVLGAVAVVAAMTGVGCAKGVNFGQQTLNGNISDAVPVINSTPACEIDMAQLALTANVNSFEFQDSNGITFGYNANGANSGIGGSISTQVTKASMSLTMQGLNPLNNSMVVSTSISSNQTTQNMNVGINFNGFGVGTNTYSSTPLSGVSAKGLSMAVQNIKSQYDKVSYIGRVIRQLSPSVVMINGGFVTGIKEGDTFNVYNVQHIWTDMGNPCGANNTYVGSQHMPADPVAVLTITSVDPSSNVSFASVYLTGKAPQINLGAEVIPLSLVPAPKGAPARYLQKKVLVKTIAAKSFTLPGGGTFDFGSAVNDQFSNAVSSNGFVVGN